MPRRRSLALAALLVLAGLPALRAVGAAPTDPPLQDPPVSAVAGRSVLQSGSWVWTDFVYDDAKKLDNAADIVSTTVRPKGDALRVEVTLNTMRRGDRPVLALALSRPGDGARRRAWPFGAGVSSPWSDLVTVTRADARLTTASGRTTHLAAPHVDAQRHTLAFDVPGWGSSPAVSVDLGAGGWDGDHGRWTDAGVADLAFNSDEAEPRYDKNSFRNHQQQDAITAGDVSAFAVRVDLAALRRGTTTTVADRPGLQTRVYRSIQHLGGGYGAEYPGMRGDFQTYTLYVPPGFDRTRRTCLALIMHSLSNINDEYAATSVYPTIAGDRGCLGVTPLAMGVDGWYWDEALVDTLQVLLDVERSFPVDRDRITLTGYSMGGYGTYRLATLLPDLFAAGAMWAGVPAYYIWPYPAPPISTPSRQSPGMAYDQLQNTEHVPLFIAQGTHDELVPVSGPTAMARRLTDLGYTHRYDLYAGFDHFSFTYVDDWRPWRDWLGKRRRVTAPADVTFTARPQSWVDSARSAKDRALLMSQLRYLTGRLGGALDGAYWVHHVVPAGTGDVSGTVHLTSSGIARRTVTTQQVSQVTPGPPYAIGFTVQAGPPFGHVLTGVERTLTDAPVANALTGTLTGVRSAVVDLRAAHLHLDGLRLYVTTDIPAQLTLVDGGRSRTVSLQPAG